MKNLNLKLYALFASFAMSFLLPVQAQNIHAILFADTQDPNVGKCDLQDFNNISVEISTIASATRMKLKRYYYKDSQCSTSNLVSVLNNLRTEADDVIIFYYTGHGTRSTGDSSEFPQMCLGSHDQSKFYPLENVLKRLYDQPARLKIVLGDCCNDYNARVSPKNFVSNSKTVLSKNPVSVYCNLFKNNKGFLISSGSQKGETSAALSTNDGKPLGGAFTLCLLTTLQQYASNGMEATWEDVMSETQKSTYEWRKHTPIYAIQIKELSDNATTTYQEPQNTAQGDESEEYEKITILAAIGNERLPIETRVKVQEKALNALFNSPGTKVEVVASNGSTVVSTETASDFVLRLCTTHNLVNLVEVDKSEDSNGRYTYLRVHEIYKK